ncbi:phytanoyl-CoA dioxygenase family protein [Horticoccus luteus]|uniref:Phytanoyl-CoA dioxygenase family protein n=1 Tax=Horticoccus luteus TaxID=2862869 RepID=A0A8F9TSU7_9BACT|nr:phytanoyl-CoA dioxygenase family protein [Horticoccus luteus]QYM78420.1 phytanoyl-CoA dioxygenase family protein [Horticoccus luteus]
MKALPNESDIAFYRAHGYFVLRQIVPPALVTDLRRTADQARAIARRLHGPQAQRLQPLDRHAELDVKPLRDFVELPELRAAVQALLTPRHQISDVSTMAFLFEPADRCWATEWHRDWRDHMNERQLAEVFAEGWERMAVDETLFNQINCALYEDTATWYVPGSHRRLENTPEEARAAKAADRAAVENLQGARSDAAQEMFLQTYCADMPGAVPLHLNTGDLAIYRSIGWHLGNYVPYRKRSTLHCAAMTSEYRAFVERAAAVMAR